MTAALLIIDVQNDYFPGGALPLWNAEATLDAIVDAIEARDEALCEQLAAEHADQIVRQIQSYIARDRTREMAL